MKKGLKWENNEFGSFFDKWNLPTKKLKKKTFVIVSWDRKKMVQVDLCKIETEFILNIFGGSANKTQSMRIKSKKYDLWKIVRAIFNLI